MFVTNSLTGGGAERSMNMVCNGLFARGWNVAIVPINQGPRDQVIPSCEIIPLQRKKQGGFFETALAIIHFNRLVKTWKPDVIILNCELPELLAATLFRRVKFVVLQHTSKPWAGRKVLGRLIRKILSHRKTSWVAVSSHLTIWPKSETPERILLNPVLERKKRPRSYKTNELERLVFVGRLSNEKRPEIILEVSKETNIPILLIGEGSMSESLKVSSRMDGIIAEFAGQIRDPWTRIQEGDLLIIPSAFEGDGLVVIEALMNEVPFLLADIPDFRRFDFPKLNYCSSVQEYKSVIDIYRIDLNKLLIPREISKQLIEGRSLAKVVDSWERFLLRQA
jgi:glycosyltransferase involved in cell wall biosynthesis